MEMRKIINLVEGKQLNEGTWSLPDTSRKARKLSKLMSEPLTPEKAKKVIYGIFGDDKLFDELDSSPKESDVRYVIASHLKELIKHYMEKPEDFNKDFDKVALGVLGTIVHKFK